MLHHLYWGERDIDDLDDQERLVGRQSYLTSSEDTEAEVFDQQRRLMSAFGGEADMPSTSRYVAEPRNGH